MDPTNSLSEDFGDLLVSERDTLTRVPPELDCYTEYENNQLDAKLTKVFSAFRMVNLDPDLPSLLSIITFGDERLVTLSVEEAEDLLTRQPSITRVLQKAWKINSFKEVRRLSESLVATQLQTLIIIQGILWPATCR
jgi:hypothetical protein